MELSCCEEDITGLAEMPVHVTQVLGEETQEKVRTYGPPQKNISSRHGVLRVWTDLQLSRMYHEVQEGSQNIWRELSKQDGSAQPWAPRNFILKYTPASALSLCLFAISPTFCFFSNLSL